MQRLHSLHSLTFTLSNSLSFNLYFFFLFFFLWLCLPLFAFFSLFFFLLLISSIFHLNTSTLLNSLFNFLFLFFSFLFFLHFFFAFFHLLLIFSFLTTLTFHLSKLYISYYLIPYLISSFFNLTSLASLNSFLYSFSPLPYPNILVFFFDSYLPIKYFSHFFHSTQPTLFHKPKTLPFSSYY